MTFTPTDAANYTSATATTTITVLKATSTITWSTPADITYGTALGATQLNATANVPGSFVYSPVAGTVLERRRRTDAVGDLHPDRRGQLHRRDGDDDDHRAEGDQHDHLVGARRHHLRHGAGRDAAERDGECARQFVYSPVAGTVLNAGAAQTLSVTFTPTDAANYTGATATTTITS